jgi:hypothetical protein
MEVALSTNFALFTIYTNSNNSEHCVQAEIKSKVKANYRLFLAAYGFL